LLLALPRGSRDAHPEGKPHARTHGLPAATRVPGHGPLARCKATTGAATPLARTGWDTQGSAPVRYAPVPSCCCPTTTPG